MAVNRYDQPAQAQFYNTYVPIPFEEILQAGQAKQGAYNTNLSNFQTAQAEAEQLQYIPNSVDEDYIRNHVLASFEDIADQYADRDFSDPNVVREINKSIRTNIDRERVRRIQQSARSYGEYQKDLRKLGLEGKTAPYLNQFDPTTFSSEYDIFSQTPEALRDFAGTAESYFNQLRDSSYITKDGLVISQVSPNDVKDVALTNLDEFMSSEEGKQAVRAMQYNGDNRDPRMVAYDFLLSRGMEFVRRNVGFAPGYGKSTNESTFSINDAANTQSINNKYLTSPKEIKNEMGIDPTKVESVADIRDIFNFDNEGNLTKKTAKTPIATLKQGEYNTAKEKGITKAKDQFEYAKEIKQKEYDKEYEKTKEIISNIRKFNQKGFSNLSDVDVLMAYTSAYNNIKNVDYDKYLYNTDEVSTSKREAITRLVIPNIGGRDIINAETGKESGKPVNTLTDLYDMFDVPKVDRQTKNIKITGIVPALGGYSASIEVNGQPRDFIISPNKKDQAVTNLVKVATQSRLNGKVGERKVNVSGREYYITTNVSSSGAGGYFFGTNIRSVDGKEVIPGKNSVALNELEAYTASVLSQLK